jgi:FAD synthase
MDLAHTPQNDAYDALQAVTPTATPYRLRGKVVNGFGRGSKLLGCPTANLDPAAFLTELQGVPRGVYMGYAQVGGTGPVYKTVLSLGTNVTFEDAATETVEAYLLHEFPDDFYGSQMALIIVGFMRSMEKYTSLDELITAIARDVRVGDSQLEMEPFKKYQSDAFFTESS